VFRRYLILLLLLAILKEAVLQNPVLRIESTGLCQSDTVIVPLQSTGFDNVGAITLYITFPSTKARFKGVANIHPLLANGLMYNSTVSPPRISIVWSSATGVNLGNSKLLDMIFELSDTSAFLLFSSDSCEIANAALPPEILDVTFLNGEIYESTPSIISQPDGRSVVPGTNCIFSVEATNSTGFRWWESRDFGVNWMPVDDGGLYSGAFTPDLLLGAIPDSYDGFMYRCEVQRENCRIDSKTALLKVGPQYSINEQETRTFSICAKPNPFVDRLTFSVWTFGPGNLELDFVGLDSKNRCRRHLEIGKAGMNEFELNIVSLPIGLTVCKYKFISKGGFNFSTGVLEIVRASEK
jgi:hypothetical protein